MNTKIILCSAIAALLLPGITQAQDPQPARNRPARSVLQELIQEIRNLPPEERQIRLRELREQLGQPLMQPGQGQPGQVQPGLGAGPLQPNPQRPLAAAQAAGDANRIVRVLTPEQRRSFRSASQENSDKVRELQEKLAEARQAVMEAELPPNFKEAALRKKLEAAAKLNAELAILRARSLAKIQPPLTDEQIEQVKNPPPQGALRQDLPPNDLEQRAPGRVQPRNPQRDRPVQNQNRPAPSDGLPPRL